LTSAAREHTASLAISYGRPSEIRGDFRRRRAHHEQTTRCKRVGASRPATRRCRLARRTRRSQREGAMSRSDSHHRRDFLARSLVVAGAAGLAASGLRADQALAQTSPRPIRRSERYDDIFITERKSFKWPGDATLAVWFAPNVEVWQYDSA